MASSGLQATHVIDVDLRDSEDSSIWEYALQQHAVVVTKDEDFARRLQQSKNGPAIVWLRVGNTSRRALLQWFEPLIPQIVEMLENGERLVELR
jgi:predicted nuclease of predicted toxin-antitoxin system